MDFCAQTKIQAIDKKFQELNEKMTEFKNTEKEVDELIKIRKEKGLHANSEVEVLEAVNGNTGYYAAVIDNRLLVKLGSGDFQPPSGWQVIKSGTGYTLWEK